MRVQKIECLENRLANYRQERLVFLRQCVPMIVGIGAVVISGLLYLLDRFSPNGFPNWKWVSVVLVACISAPALLAMKPKRPTQDDVLADQVLRRAHGLDDTVER
jgi:hypothetical protein